MPSYVYRNGDMVEIPDTTITESCEIHETVTNALVIKAGVTVTARSNISGTVNLERGARLDAHGPVNGTVAVSAGAQVAFYDRVGGTVHVHAGAEAVIAPSSVALGTLVVEGLLTNEGVRGIQVSGSGRVVDAPGSEVRQPDERWSDGTVVYRN